MAIVLAKSSLALVFGTKETNLEDNLDYITNIADDGN